MVCMQKLATSIAQVYLGQRDKPDLPLPGLPLALAAGFEGRMKKRPPCSRGTG
jgi:CRISPR-associated protein Cas1